MSFLRETKVQGYTFYWVYINYNYTCMHSRDSHAILVTKYFAKITHLFLQYSQTVYLVYSSVISLLNSESRNKSNGTHLLWTSCKKTSYEWVCMVFMHDVSSSQEMCKNEFSYYNYNECMAAGVSNCSLIPGSSAIFELRHWVVEWLGSSVGWSMAGHLPGRSPPETLSFLSHFLSRL